MDVWSHLIDECGPKRIKKIGLRQIDIENLRDSFNSEGQGEISVFPLTKLIMDVPLIP